MHLQKTIRAPISACGVGVHSGKNTRITFNSAPANTGIIFRRVDISPNVEIKALASNVVDTRLSTCLGHNGYKVSTVEHLLSAIAGLGIDNLYIDADSEEIPIMDGSSAPFIFLLKSSGVISQNMAKKFLKIKKPITIKNDDKSASLAPFNGFKVNFHIDFNHPAIPKSLSNIEIDFSSTSFIHDISRARTFGFLKDIEALQKQNLALGGNLNNSIVLDEKSTLNSPGLRFEDEFVRHKVLDAIGDLYLFGMPILGNFIGIKSGHALNNLLINKVLADQAAWEIVSFNENDEIPIKFLDTR